jgi:WD40 repeat protein
MGRRGAALLLVLAAALPRGAAAQFGYFGQNKVQYRRFDWRVLRSEHVDLYYYPEEEELGRVALAYAEESYGVLERRFLHAVRRRIPLIIYASHTDFEQTNILPFVPPEGLLGVTEFMKRRVTLPFTGSYTDFRHTLRHELVHVFQLSLAAEVFTRYPRIHHADLPLWYTEGLAEYFSAGEDSRDEMILRDITIDGQLPSLKDLTYAYGGIVYPMGGIIHRFLAETYGEWRVPELYRQLWKYPSFDEAMASVYGRSLAQLSEEWQFWMRRRYFPVVAQATPLALTARLLTRLAIKPAAYSGGEDSAGAFLYFSPSSGYTNIYLQPLDSGARRTVVQGERSTQFESFHFFESRMDAGPSGIVVFGSRYQDRDALFFWKLADHRVVGRYQFPELVSILSPAWAPDGKSVVFSGLSISGYSDLYRLWLPDGRLERLTSDRYQDLDPSVSPDGRTVVFASDRTAFGPQGGRNLFVLDLASGAVRYLTYGDWRDDTPRWAAATDRIYFSSDRDGTPQIYSVDSLGNGRRETNTVNGAFDPQYVDARHGLVFGGFADLSFNIYTAQPAADSAPGAAFALAAERRPAQWSWPELENPQYARADAMPFEKKYTLDVATGDAVVAPGLGSAQGAVFLLSDQLSDHLLFFGLSSFQIQGSGFTNLLDNINGTAFYLDQSHRVNWGVGAFRLRGLFYEGDFSTVFDETSAGVFGQLRYPLSRFRRLEAEYRIEHSDRLDIARPDLLNGNGDPSDFHRVGWLASNYLSYIKDNTLWLETGPIDGERFNFTGGLVSDLSSGRFDSWVFTGDWRRYFRTSLHSAFAVRTLGYFAGGERPRRINIGGSWALRGYPGYGYVGGTRAWLVNAEWRFPITDFLALGFPFGELRFPGVQGALFVDYGRAWTEFSAARGMLGSTGLGFRMPVGPPLVLRLDIGWRFHNGNTSLYSLPERSRRARFVDFFFGFNY